MPLDEKDEYQIESIIRKTVTESICPVNVKKIESIDKKLDTVILDNKNITILITNLQTKVYFLQIILMTLLGGSFTASILVGFAKAVGWF